MIALKWESTRIIDIDISDFPEGVGALIFTQLSKTIDPSSISQNIVPEIFDEGNRIFLRFKTKTMDDEVIKALFYNLERKVCERAKELGIQI